MEDTPLDSNKLQDRCGGALKGQYRFMAECAILCEYELGSSEGRQGVGERGSGERKDRQQISRPGKSWVRFGESGQMTDSSC